MKEIQNLTPEEYKVYNQCINTLVVAYVEYTNKLSEMTELDLEEEGIALLDSIALICNRLQIHPDQIKKDILDSVNIKHFNVQEVH